MQQEHHRIRLPMNLLVGIFHDIPRKRHNHRSDVQAIFRGRLSQFRGADS